MYSLKSSALIAIHFLLIPLVALSQDTSRVDLNDDWEFLTKSRDHYQEWLESTELSKVLRVTDLLIASSKLVVLDLEATSGADWVNLRTKYADRNGTDLRRMLFDKLLFLSELETDQAGIRIRTALKDYYVDMRYKNDTLAIHESKLRGSGQGTTFIDAQKLPKSNKVNSTNTINKTKVRLKKYFKHYYDGRDGWFNDSKFEVVKEEVQGDKHHLHFKITNIRGEILNDFNIPYYERIRISITLYEENGGVVFVYEIFGKYGSGIIYGPRKNAYKDMEIKYEEYLIDYAEDFAPKIRQALQRR